MTLIKVVCDTKMSTLVCIVQKTKKQKIGGGGGGDGVFLTFCVTFCVIQSFFKLLIVAFF